MTEFPSQENAPKIRGDGALASGDPDGLPRTFGRLTLLRRLARGGMGEVYLAATNGIEGAERPCVVKTIRTEHEDDRSFRARFLDETRIQAQLHHPGVAQILEAATTSDGLPYAVVEYVEGRHLGEILARSNQLGVTFGWADAVAVAISFGDALAHVHERTDASGSPLEIAHRDLSPQNVMLGYAGDLKLIDFGTARGENRRCRTVSGIVYAKPGYVAPEVANQTPGGAPADLYAFGVMLWELVAGHRFLQGDAVEHQALVARGERLLPPLSRQCGSPERLDDILRRLTAVSLAERYPNARRAASELADLLKLAPSLADGERSVRGRIANMMQRLYPAEPARSRADFARRVAQSRKSVHESGAASGRPGIPEPSPAPALAGPSVQGSVLSGTRYRLVKLIASGGMGEVWEAAHLDLGRSVALKLIPEAASRSAEARQRFRAEARAVARLDHPGLVKIHDFGVTADGRCYFAMELLEGETLQTRLARGTLPWKQAVALIIEVASALSAAHGAGIVHRDITPANLFLTQKGAVKLLDFGVCHSFEHHSEARAGAPLVVGTPEYISPEQAAGAVPDARSDLYSLGVVLYEALTGVVPHPLGAGGAPSLAALLTAKITVTPLAPALVAPGSGVSARLDRLVLSMLERDADKRPATAGDASGQLEALLHQGPRRQPRLALAGLSAALAFGTLAWVGFVLGHAEGQSLSSHDAALSKAEDELVQLVAEARSQAVVEDSAAQEGSLAPASAPEAAPTPPVEPGADEAATALALAQRGQKIRAHHLMKEVLAKHPESAAVQRAAVTTARGVGAWGEAIEAARRWTVLEPSTESLIALARLQRATLDRGASATLERVLLADPSSREARKLLASYSAEKVATR